MSMPLTISANASLIAEPARALMLSALLDGRALPAGELAHAAGITPQTASSHLAKLLHAGFIACETQGRHRYYRLSGAQIAETLEHLATTARPRSIPSQQVSRELQFARRCYDHLAGHLGVAVTEALQRHDYIQPIAAKQFAVTAAGAQWFTRIGVNIAELPKNPRGVARQCLDWTERRHHLAGPLGVRLLTSLCELDWLRRSRSSRCVLLTAKGAAALKAELDIRVSQAAAA
jgi:DNA-binding transcriptional ArsR family regulator